MSDTNSDRQRSQHSWQKILSTPERAAKILQEPAKQKQLAEYLSLLEADYKKLKIEHEELRLLHEVTVEHGTNIEEQLAIKIEEIEALATSLKVRNNFIREVFGRYMTDEVVATLLESPGALKLGGEKRQVSILMSDLRGFSALCERLTPEQVVRTLNIYLAVMAEIIENHQGTINDFIGDAILAVFGAPILRPDNAQRAIACALSMQIAMQEINATMLREGLATLEMGIGVHTGEVVVGNIGSKRRAKYGLVGSPVNLASRIESYSIGGQVLASDATVKELGEQVITKNCFEVTPKGIKQPITIYEVMGMKYPQKLLVLPQQKDDLEPLVTEAAILISVVEGKNVREQQFPAKILKLGQGVAEIYAEKQIRPFVNIKIMLTNEQGAAQSDDVYAKVSHVSLEKNIFQVHFTSAPSTVRKVFHHLQVQKNERARSN